MTMTIGGITLDHDLDWVDEFDPEEVSAGSADRALTGHMVTQSFPIIGGRPLTLEGDDSHGWLKRTTVQALHSLAYGSPDVVHTVVLNGTTYSAMFRNEDQPTVAFKKITPATNPGPDFWYYGTIKMRIL
jgi:hypothetical protein